MVRQILFLAAAGVAMVALTGAAGAEMMVSATTAVNVHSGPGSRYEIIGVLGAGKQASLAGCLKNSGWCSVAMGDGQGWVYSDYLAIRDHGRRVVLSRRPSDVEVPVVNDDGSSTTASVTARGTDDDASGTGAAGARAAATPEKPAAAAIVQAAEPPQMVRTYMMKHRPNPVYLNGHVVVGAGLPENVPLDEIPDYKYRYVVVNGQSVLVDPRTRRIVYVVRQ